MLNNIGLPGLLMQTTFIVVTFAALSAVRGKNKPQGNVVVLLVWAVLFFPIAILHALMRKWGGE